MKNCSLVHMFYVPLITFACENWENKKNEINKLPSKPKTYKDTGVSTDYFTQLHDNKFQYNDIVHKIFASEIDALCKMLGMVKAKVSSSWIQTYKFKAWHEIHNHGSVGYSGICYVDFDKHQHNATQFICPFNNFIAGDILTYTKMDIEEGMVSFFPSVIHHQVIPNKSKKVRKILSFNLSFS